MVVTSWKCLYGFCEKTFLLIRTRLIVKYGNEQDFDNIFCDRYAHLLIIVPLKQVDLNNQFCCS